MPLSKIPVSVVIVTKNEASRIARCLQALAGFFDEVLVVDSGSSDTTKMQAEQFGVPVIDFSWDGRYPKKRQWCLDNLDLKHDRVFFVDADEVATPELREEMHQLKWNCAGYFIKGRYVFADRALRFGLKNNKLALLDRRKMKFPVVDDLDLPGMGEIEGHYQPVLKKGYEGERIGQLDTPLLHYAYEDQEGWKRRHERYAAWESGMNTYKAWPQDTRLIKRIFRILPFRASIAFAHCYILKLGFLDGIQGLRFAQTRYQYYKMIK